MDGFKFMVDFGIEGSSLVMDEPEPVGDNAGPSASKILAAAMGNCLTASLMFCLQKTRAEVGEVETKVNGVMRRNHKSRWRIAEINVEINPEISDEFKSQYDRCHGLFEEFCIISKSIEQGIPINVKVNPK
ncbi:MAG: OsmC family protein [Candidatus Bathyarchaeota archaeon]|nr:OsmC family protein [Candidatus Bathyarchaeota archaeon]